MGREKIFTCGGGVLKFGQGVWYQKTLREMEIKPFGREHHNFVGLGEFEEATAWD